MTTETLRAAIEAALRRRDARGMAALLACDDADVDESIRATTAHTRDDALRALAIACGLRPDGSDPAEEVERLTAALDRAHHALREYGPRCAHPGCDALAPLRCDDCGARFCDAHDDGRTGHDAGVAAPMPHAVGPDDLMAGAAMRSAEVAR